MELFYFTHAVEMNVQCVNFFLPFFKKRKKSNSCSSTVSTAMTCEESGSVFTLVMLSMHKKQNYGGKACSYKVSKEFYSISEKNC